MFTSLPSRRLRWSAGAAGRSSPNHIPAPHSRNVTSRTRQNQSRSQSGAPGLKTHALQSCKSFEVIFCDIKSINVAQDKKKII